MATKQKSGLYRAKVKIGNDASGKPIYKYISGRTKKELEAERRYVLEHYIEGVGVVNDVLFSVYLQTWYDAYRKTKLSPSTKRCYGVVMNNYLIPHFGNRNLRSISSIDLQQYMNTLTGRSSGIINLNQTILRGVFSCAARDHIITENIAAYVEKPTAKPTKEKYVLSSDERKRIEQICETDEHGLMLAFLYYTGMRLGEMLALQWGDIDLTTNMVHIQRDADSTTHDLGTLKTKQSNRLVPIPKQLAAMLLKIPRGLPTVQLFPGRNHPCVTSVAFYYMFDKMMDQCNLKGKITPHVLRHNYLTMCYESGIDPYTAARLAGHSNINTTMNVYTHISKSHMSTIATQVETMFSNEGCKKVAQNK